jgi:hypothetical protein
MEKQVNQPSVYNEINWNGYHCTCVLSNRGKLITPEVDNL